MYSILYVSETKRQAETISYLGDFRDTLFPGETITSQVVTVALITGTDPDPAAMLYSGIEVHNGNVIEQRIEMGVVGCIYDIIFSVGTNLGNSYEKFTRLAILPTDLTADQLHSTWYRTSWRYPYNMAAEGIQGIGNLSGGPLWYNPSFGDQFQGSAMLLSGSLFVGATSYSMVPEAIQGSAVLLSGTITLVAIFYTDVPDAIQGNAALLNGTFYQGQVSFTNPAEAIQGNATLNSGTLV